GAGALACARSRRRGARGRAGRGVRDTARSAGRQDVAGDRAARPARRARLRAAAARRRPGGGRAAGPDARRPGTAAAAAPPRGRPAAALRRRRHRPGVRGPAAAGLPHRFGRRRAPHRRPLPRRRLQDQLARPARRAADRGGVRARAARGGDDALLLPLAGAAVRRRAAPVPALAAARLPARAAPRRGALPVRARHVRPADARRRRAAVRRLRVAPAGRARRRGVRPARRRGGERMSEVAVTGAGDEPVPAREEFARDTARSAEGLLAELNHPDGLSAADVHVARRFARLGGCDDEKVLVAAALAVRAVRQGSVCLDLASDRAQELLGEHAWEPAQWRAALLASSLVREAADDAVTPLVLDGDRLYLDRYWGEE